MPSIRTATIQALTRKLDEFIATMQKDAYGLGNAWLKTERLSIYVRYNERVIQLPGEAPVLLPMLDIANVELVGRYRGRGYFSEFIMHAERVNPWAGIYMENVHHDRHRLILEKNGYRRNTLIVDETFGISLFKRNDHGNTNLLRHTGIRSRAHELAVQSEGILPYESGC